MRKVWLLVVVLAGCGGNDNREPPAPLAEFAPLVTVTEHWHGNAGGGDEKANLKLTPAVAGENVFTAAPKGRVRAFELETGTLLWTHKTDFPISAGVSAGEGMVLAGGHGGELLALVQDSGEVLWQAAVSSEILAPAYIGNGVVAVRSVDGKLTALSAKSGQRLWTYEQSVPLLSLRGTSAPQGSGDLIIAGFDNGHLAALDATTGKLVWESLIHEPRGRSDLERMADIDAGLAITDYAVFAIGYQGYLAAVGISNGEILWKKETSSYTGFALDYGTLYLSDAHGHVLAFDRAHGEVLWKQDKLQGRRLTAPALIDNYLVVGDLEGYLHWLRLEDGQFAARDRVSKAPLQSAPIVAGDKLIAQNSDGRIAVFSVNDEDD